ncbi:collagen-like protein [Gluconobacter cerevisiae]|uniref:Collagen-like protein n=1 Tax=Gluconobacter cerevisiae TaxID=1379734 RepID=A0ABR9YEC3_9PROT|nr:collagen-like protein [Gluconobacter cerevisiae]MBF0877018.1 collagen-like protein [Gluconobacter cerevisiae]
MTTVNNLAPSPLRTIVLQGRNGTTPQVILCPKASADCLDYTLDFSALLAGTDDTPTAIRSATLTATGGQYDLKVMWSAVAGPLVVAFLASGKPDTTQKILFEITTQQGRVYSVMAVLQITTLTAATAPPSNFLPDTLTNGKVLIAGIEALPSGYSSNGRVVMATENAAPVGTPSFESVTAGTYSGDGSGLDVTSGAKVQTIGQWIAALSSGGAQGVGIKAINVTQGAVVAGQPSTVTLTATLTDGTTTSTKFDAPAGSPGTQGLQGNTGTAGADGKDGQAGPVGVGIASVAVSQGPITAGQSSTVTLTATMTNGATAPGVSFEVPPGAEGSATDLTAAAINTALGYTAANGAEYFPLSVDVSKTIPSIVRSESSTANSGGLYTLSDSPTSGPTMQVGLIAGMYSSNAYVIKSLNNNLAKLSLYGQDGYGASLWAVRYQDGTQTMTTDWWGIDAKYGAAGFMFVNSDSNLAYWKFVGDTSGAAGWPKDLKLFAGTSDNSNWQTTPLVAFSSEKNVATFANEPLVLTAYTFATLPASPEAWQRAVVTDKAIGSGAQGVMAMWNPNAKAWTGLSGEALV